MRLSRAFTFFVVWLFVHSDSHAAKTLHITWNNDSVCFHPTKMRDVTFAYEKASGQLTVSSLSKVPLSVSLSGHTDKGSVVLSSNKDCNLIFDGITIMGGQGIYIQVDNKGLTNIILATDSHNVLCDTLEMPCDSDMMSKSFIRSTGNLSISGEGHLDIITDKQDAIDCKNFSMSEGVLSLRISKPAAKGIKCKTFAMNGGIFNGYASGDAVWKKDSVCKFSSLLKCGKNVTLTGGNLSLRHAGRGGRCLSCNDTLTVSGCKLDLSATGDGGWFGERAPGKFYFSLREYRTYYSSHCINTENAILSRGDITCNNTGSGGKGIVVSNTLQIGALGDKQYSDGPAVTVNTSGKCILNDKDYDLRDGCPKGIVSHLGTFYSGDISVKTYHMGGEGVECDSLILWNPRLYCNTYDDGINVENDLTIHGGEIFCNSVDNDGIDSNGSIHIDGGIIASISQHQSNESFDSENAQFYLTGGLLFGIGNSTVKLQPTMLALYNSPSFFNEEIRRKIPDLVLENGDYISIVKGNEVVMTLLNTDQGTHCSVFAVHPDFKAGDSYQLTKSKVPPQNSRQLICDNHLWLGGEIRDEDKTVLKDIVTQPWSNNDNK